MSELRLRAVRGDVHPMPVKPHITFRDGHWVVVEFSPSIFRNIAAIEWCAR